MTTIRVGLEPTGLEAPLSETERAVQQNVRRFAEKVLRPIGMALDRLAPDQVVAPESPLWQTFREFSKLGLSVSSVMELPPEERGRLMPIVFEELGWGDGGLAIALGASMVPTIVTYLLQNPALRAKYPETLIGCWGVTEPDHGTDMLDVAGALAQPGTPYGRPNCVARIEGNEMVIDGQKSAWVSNGTIAQVCALYTVLDRGNGLSERCVVMVPLDAKGVSRGKPLDKLGQRALPQGEIFFDRVRLPLDHLLVGPEHYELAEYGILCEANALMGSIWLGCARAAYEHAHAYAHERRQGGVPIVRHQSVRHRLFHMFRKIEAARALSRRVCLYNATAPLPAIQGSIASKITSTQTAFEVASEAVQMFGGNGVTREYPVEKLLRDARSSMIEDGCNEVLAIKGGAYLSSL